MPLVAFLSSVSLVPSIYGLEFNQIKSRAPSGTNHPTTTSYPEIQKEAETTTSNLVVGGVYKVANRSRVKHHPFACISWSLFCRSEIGLPIASEITIANHPRTDWLVSSISFTLYNAIWLTPDCQAGRRSPSVPLNPIPTINHAFTYILITMN